jgi:hypothetical protein
VDVWVEGKTLMIRQRQGLVESPGPMWPEPGALNTLTVAELRTSSLMIRAHFLDYIRVFRPVGATTGAPCRVQDFEIINEQHDDGRFRTTTNALRRKSNGAMFNQQIEVYDLGTFEFVSRTTTVWQQDGAIFDSN